MKKRIVAMILGISMAGVCLSSTFSQTAFAAKDKTTAKIETAANSTDNKEEAESEVDEKNQAQKEDEFIGVFSSPCGLRIYSGQHV